MAEKGPGCPPKSPICTYTKHIFLKGGFWAWGLGLYGGMAEVKRCLHSTLNFEAPDDVPHRAAAHDGRQHLSSAVGQN